MGTTTAGLPLGAGAHYEKCPACATVYRSKRRTRFRCPQCHRLAYTVPTPDGEPGSRRSLEDDGQGRVFRVLDRRPEEGEAPPAYGDDVVMFLEDSTAPPPLSDTPPPASHAGARARGGRSAADLAAAAAREQGAKPAGRLRRIWSGSLGDLFRG